MKTLRVNLKARTDRSYVIYLNTSYIKNLVLDIKKNNWGEKYAIITDSKVKNLYANELQKKLKRAGINSEIFSFHNGEKYKTLEQAEKLLHSLSKAEFSRDDAIIALGGGVIGDMAGFVSSVYMRGIPYIQVPTTLLSMVDSSVGGKTGVDTKWGKNLIGTFHQPKSVHIDFSFLKTLPKKQIKNGIAEIIKYGVIAKPSILKLLDKKYNRIIKLDKEIINKIVGRCIKIKTSIVQRDEKESDLRRILNYGHTFGHTVEKLSNFKIQHGEAVSIGMSMINTIAADKKILSKKDRDYIKNIIKKYKLPRKLPATINSNKIIETVKYDKKAKKGKIMFIIPKKIGNVILSDKITRRDIIKTCKKHS